MPFSVLIIMLYYCQIIVWVDTACQTCLAHLLVVMIPMESCYEAGHEAGVSYRILSSLPVGGTITASLSCVDTGRCTGLGWLLAQEFST